MSLFKGQNDPFHILFVALQPPFSKKKHKDEWPEVSEIVRMMTATKASTTTFL